jgi:hypothetical protein
MANIPVIDFTQILMNAGSAGLVAVLFLAFMWFDSKKKATTLVVKDDERKDDTDMVAEKVRESDNKQEVEIALLKKEQENQCNDILEIRKNHLKHQERIERALVKIAVRMKIENLFE